MEWNNKLCSSCSNHKSHEVWWILQLNLKHPLEFCYKQCTSALCCLGYLWMFALDYVYTWKSKNISNMVRCYIRPSILRTLGASERGQIPPYLGLGRVRIVICLTSDRGIKCPRYSTPRIFAGIFFPMDSEVYNEWKPSGLNEFGVHLGLERHKTKKISGFAMCLFDTNIPCIPRTDPRYT